MNVSGPPIERGFVSDARQIEILLKPDRPTSELELKAILMNEFGWTAERVHQAVSSAQAKNTIRWVAFQGWLLGGRPD